MLMAPNTGKRREKRVEGGDELDARQGVDSSAHLKLEEDTVLTAGTASRRGTRLSSMSVSCCSLRLRCRHSAGHRSPDLGPTGYPVSAQMAHAWCHSRKWRRFSQCGPGWTGARTVSLPSAEDRPRPAEPRLVRSDAEPRPRCAPPVPVPGRPRDAAGRATIRGDALHTAIRECLPATASPPRFLRSNPFPTGIGRARSGSQSTIRHGSGSSCSGRA